MAIVAAGVLAILFGIAMTLVISSGITRPLGEALQAARRLAEGDLTIHLDAKGEDEAGQLTLAMKSMVEKLREFAIGVKGAVDNVA
jgi:methyl-accepting chemotaxis protein